MSIGLNFHATDLPNSDGIRRLQPRWGLFLLDPEDFWNSNLGLWPEVKALSLQCQPIVRLYRPDVMSKSPEFRAAQVCQLLRLPFGDEPVNIIPGNELDQAIEHAGNFPRGSLGLPVSWFSSEGLKLIAAWLSEYADAHRALRPRDILHLPACSAAMPWPDWFAAMINVLPRYDYADLHTYQLGNYVPSVMDGKPVFLTEWGSIGASPEEYATFARALGDTMNCIWKWSEPDRESNPEGDPAGYAIADRLDVIEALAEISGEAGVNDMPEVTGTDSRNTSPPYGLDIIAPTNIDTTGGNMTQEAGMKQQEYLDTLADIWGTADRLQKKYKSGTWTALQRIKAQCEILDDLKVQEEASQPPFRG